MSPLLRSPVSPADSRREAPDLSSLLGDILDTVSESIDDGDAPSPHAQPAGAQWQPARSASRALDGKDKGVMDEVVKKSPAVKVS